jgi:phosphatidylinositol glycan class B
MKGTLLDRFKYLMLNIATVALMIITSIIYDTLYFTKFTWTALNFLEFNLLTNGADFYGVHNPLWYVTECIPYLLVGALPFLGLGLIKYVSDEINKKNDLHLIVILVLFLAILSIPAHKEDRMLMTVWPILILLTTYGFVNMKSSKFKKLLIILTLITNVALFSFMGLHHNRAAFSIFGTLRA